jgi:hypothetical protein
MNYVCVMRYNEEPGGRGIDGRTTGHHKHLQVRILQRLNFGGSLSSCSEIPPFCKPLGRFAESGAGWFWIVDTIGDARSYV